MSERVRQVARMTKADLLQVVLTDAGSRGRRWVLGGPKDWSKDELVRYVIHETAFLIWKPVPVPSEESER
jgi:hypothetical protein